MSMLRYAAPGRAVVLIDEGPAIHVPRPGHGIRGNTTSGFVPFVVLPIVQSDKERARTIERRATKLRGEGLIGRERPLCRAEMRFDETCARMAGHKDLCRSRARMDADARGRQSCR